ncbi:GNAT family N-acetyltransferase, partial [Streptomyces sp. NPDC057052]|uniref:GNAT family N-acetyltransferase n=1 Tax=Streptomyces sp. NPDC057052 TaxID=3346010 RepID=UPI003626C6B4
AVLLRAVADLVLDSRPGCARVVAEPDIRNTPSVAAFLAAGFRFSAEVGLPAKRAALMIRDRASRHLL